MLDNEVLYVYRGGVIENVHHGHIAAVDSQGRLLYSFGNPYRITHGRSALKPFQVLPLISTGTADHFDLSPADLALCASSHSGEKVHQTHVKVLLQKVGRQSKDLQCGIMKPIDAVTHEEMIRNGEPVTEVCNECSGVHVGMMGTAMYMGEDWQQYHVLSSPVQQRVLEAVSTMTDTSPTDMKSAIDGCNIPTFCLPLAKIAFGFARMTDPEDVPHRYADSIRRIVSAYLQHPEMITGENTYSTRVIREFGGRVLVKEGSQGVFGMCDFQTGVGVAIKIEDGRKTELPPVLNEVFRQLQIGVDGPLDELSSDTNPPLKTVLDDVVGQFKAEFKLKSHVDG